MLTAFVTSTIPPILILFAGLCLAVVTVECSRN